MRQRRVILRKRFLPVFLLLIGLIGCEPPRVEVTGLVEVNGRPVPELEVVFDPVDEAKGLPGVGTTDDQGKFVLRSPDGRRKGVPLADYLVRVTGTVTDPATGQQYLIPSRYNTDTELNRTVRTDPDFFRLALTVESQ